MYSSSRIEKQTVINLNTAIPGIWDLNLGFSKLQLIKTDKINLSLSIIIILVVFSVWSIWN
jgi:hypothetical protein